MLIKNLKEDRKKIFFAICAVLVIHLFKFVNYFPNWDSIGGIDFPWSGMTHHGRWFSGVLTRLLSSQYDLQWVEGVVSAIFIALFIVLLLRMFNIQNKVYSGVAIVLFAGFCCIASTFTYAFLAPAYAFAMFLAVLGAYLAVSTDKKAYIPLSIVAFALSLGTYQVYFPLAVIAFLYYIGSRLLNENTKFSDLKSAVIRFVISLFGGAVLYWVINKLVLIISQIEISSYQGVSDVGFLGFDKYIILAKTSIMAFITFFTGGTTLTLYGVINACLIFSAVVLAFIFIIFNKKYSIGRKIWLCILFLSVVPLTYCFYFLSDGVFYHRLMEMGNFFVYFFIFIILEHHGASVKTGIKNAIITVLIVLCFYNFVNDNIAYQQMSVSYERTYFEISEIMSRIDSLNTESAETVAIIGKMEQENETICPVPSITGASVNNFARDEGHIIAFSKYYLGRNYTTCSKSQRDLITESDEFKEMGTFPQNDCVRVIDGVVVVKLSETQTEAEPQA